MIKKILFHAGLFFALLGILILLLMASAAIPNKLLMDGFRESAMAYSQVDSFIFNDGNRLFGVGDNYADCVLLGVTYQMGIDGPIDTKYYDGESLGENAGLYLMLNNGAEPNTDYTRYWHGTAMLIRPLLLFMDVSAIKMVGFFAIVLLIALTLAYLVKKRHTPLAIALSVSLILVEFWNLHLSMEYQSTFMIAFLMIPLWIYFEKRESVLTYLALSAGTLTAFFDFLTTETVTVILPLVIIFAIRLRENRITGSFMTVTRCGVAWISAYALTFAAKWTIATIATGKNCFTLAFTVAEERFVGESGGFLSGLIANFSTIFGGYQRIEPMRVVLGITVTALVFASALYLRGKPKKGAWLLPLTASLVLVRFMLVNNHSYLHEFFTYRALVSLIFALIVILIPERGKKKRS